jgi:DNA-binding NarL/FixJ family response regulator
VLRSAHPLEFLHPLVGAAVYAGLGPAARSRDHGRAAHLLDADGASAERVAAQLLRCQPAGDAWAFERLVAAAEQASARTAIDAVATFLQRALDEPAPPERRGEILLELGAAQVLGDPLGGIAHVREALDLDLDVDQRFRATMLLAGVLGQTGFVAEAAEVLEQQFEAFIDRPDLRGQTEAALANITRIEPATRARAAGAIERMRRRVAAGVERDPSVLGTIAAEMAMAGEPNEPIGDIAERAVIGIEGTATLAHGWSWYNAVRALTVSGHYDAALRSMAVALERNRERGAVLDIGGVLTFRAELYLHVGDLTNAEVDARTLKEISLTCGWPLGEGFSAAWLCEVLIDRGELDEAERVLSEEPFARPAAELAPVLPYIWVLLARGRLRLAQARPSDAVVDLREAGRRSIAIGLISPTVAPWRSLLADALLDLDQASEAERLATEELELARKAQAPRAIGVALRTAARMGDEIPRLRESIEALRIAEARLERARSHAALGAALRRAGQAEDARTSLRCAVDLAHRCGADALEDEALAELRATGARPRRRVTTGAGALTPSERRIAELAAAGQQNREIAEALFVTMATVEFHLRNAYRKLGISSRTQLAAALN